MYKCKHSHTLRTHTCVHAIQTQNDIWQNYFSANFSFKIALVKLMFE